MSLSIDINPSRVCSCGMVYGMKFFLATINSFDWIDSLGVVVAGTDVAGVPTLALRFKARGMNGWISCPLISNVAVHYEQLTLGSRVFAIRCNRTGSEGRGCKDQHLAHPFGVANAAGPLAEGRSCNWVAARRDPNEVLIAKKL